MDLEIDNDNRVWASTTLSPEYTTNDIWDDPGTEVANCIDLMKKVSLQLLLPK